MARDKKSISKDEADGAEGVGDTSLALLSSCEEKCNECIAQCEAHPVGDSEDGEATPVKALDLATFLLLAKTVRDIIKFLRDRK